MVACRDMNSNSLSLKRPQLVGRDKQMMDLQAVYRHALEGRGGVVVVKALSGVGKTRLLQEFEKKLSDNVYWGIALDKSAMEPFAVFQNVVTKTIEAAKHNEPLLRRIRDGMSGWQESASRIFPQFKEIFSSEEKRFSADSATQTRALRAIQHFIDSLGSRNSPAVVILDDCQWADELSILMLYEWAQSFADKNILVILAYRSNEVDPQSRLGRIKSIVEIELGNLDYAEIIQMIESISGPVEEKISQLVHRLSGGNPFLVSAVFQGLKETSAIQLDNGQWKMLENQGDTLSYQIETKHFLQRRIELLSEKHQQVLQHGAILGKVIDISLLTELLGIPLSELQVLLNDLEKRHILSASDGQSVSFVHDKIREAVFAFCNNNQLREINFKIAEYLEKNRPESIYQIAFHYDSSGNFEKASRFAAKASAEALKRQSLALAEEYYQLALKGLQTLPLEVKREVLSGYGNVLMGRAKYAQSISVLEQAQMLTDDPLQKAEIDLTMGMAYGFQSNTNKAIESFLNGLKTLKAPFPRGQIKLLLAIFFEILQYIYMLVMPAFLVKKKKTEDAKRELAVGRLYIRLAYPFFFESRLPEMCYLGFRGKNITDRIEDSPEKAFFNSGFQQIFLSVQWFEAAAHYGKIGIKIASKLKDEWVLATCYEFYGYPLLFAGKINESIENFLKATKMFEQLGYRWDENISRCNLAYAFYYLGNLSEAVLECKHTLNGTRDIKDFQSLTPALFTWARASMGNVPEQNLFEFYDEVERADMQSRTQLRAAISLWHMRHGKFEEAEKLLKETWKMVSKYPLKSEYIFSCVIWLPTIIRKHIEKHGNSEYFKTREKDLSRQLRAAWKAAKKYPLMRAHVFREIAYFYMMQGKSEKVSENLAESLETATHHGQRYEIAQTHFAMAEAAKKFGWDGYEELMVTALNGLKDCGADVTYFRLE